MQKVLGRRQHPSRPPHFATVSFTNAFSVHFHKLHPETRSTRERLRDSGHSAAHKRRIVHKALAHALDRGDHEQRRWSVQALQRRGLVTGERGRRDAGVCNR